MLLSDGLLIAISAYDLYNRQKFVPSSKRLEDSRKVIQYDEFCTVKFAAARPRFTIYLTLLSARYVFSLPLLMPLCISLEMHVQSRVEPCTFANCCISYF